MAQQDDTIFERGSGPRWFDSWDLPRVRAFYEPVLERYDTSLLEWVKLRALPSNAWSFACGRPVRVEKGSRLFKSGYRLRAGINRKRPFPRRDGVRVGWVEATETMDGHPLFRRVEFVDESEVGVFALGGALFRFLRHSKQIPGLDIKSRARRQALYCLAVFRTGHLFDPFDETDRLVARDALEEAGDAESLALIADYDRP